MIRLDTTTRKLQIKLGSAPATTQLPVVVSYSDKTATTYDGASKLSTTNSGTAVDICTAPAASTVRDVDHIGVYNIDTGAVTVTLQYNDNGTLYPLSVVVLSVGDKLVYTHAEGWKVTDVIGALKTTLGAALGTGNHEVYVTTGNGYGSTNTAIRRFTTTLRSVGTAIAYADSATAGATFTINEAGIYSINYTDTRAAGDGAIIGISLNSSQLTTTIDSITAANRLAMAMNAPTYAAIATITAYLAGSDVIRAHTRGLENSASATQSYFQIRKLGA